MTRRDLFHTLPALGLAASGAKSAPTTPGRVKPGLVAYSYRKQLESKALTYEDLIRRVADMGLDGLDTTVYWFPDNSPEFLAGLRRTAYKNAVQLYSAAVRVRLCQPTPELQKAEFENAKKWIDVTEQLGATH